MSTIQVQCVDQALKILNSPLIASGGINEDYIEFSFCPLWDGFGKTAIFFKNKNTVYRQVLDANDSCQIPTEMTQDEGKMFFAVFGTKTEGTETLRRTSEILSYVIVEGAIFSNTVIPSDPTASVYEQILAQYGNLSTRMTAAETSLAGKQNLLTFDTTPTTGSTNPVTSGGIRAAIDSAIVGGVTSFNGRTGAVLPASGDYSYSDVGADAAGAAAAVQGNLNTHTGDTSNPHSVTATQAGAVSYLSTQNLTDANKLQARRNIDAIADELVYAGTMDRSTGSHVLVPDIQLYKGIFLSLRVSGGGSSNIYRGVQRIPKEVFAAGASETWMGFIEAYTGDILYRYTVSDGDTITYSSTGSGHTYELKVYYYR